MPKNDRKRQNESNSVQDIEALLAEPVAARPVMDGAPVETRSALTGRRNSSGKLSRTQRGKRGLAAQRPDRAPSRQLRARERQAYWSGLSTSAKLKALQGRPGESKKQRARLELLAAKEVPPPPAPKPVVAKVVLPSEAAAGTVSPKKSRKKS